MRESSIALSKREHLTNDTESHRVGIRITTAEVACKKKQNVLFKKNTVKPLLSGHLRLNKGCKNCAMFVNDQHSTVTLYCDKVVCC